MNHIECEVLLYAGKWLPRHSNSLGDSVRHALFKMGHYRGLYFHTIELESLTGDGPCVAVHLTADWMCDDAEVFGDWVHEVLVYQLHPEFESQIEIERSEVVSDGGDYEVE